MERGGNFVSADEWRDGVELEGVTCNEREAVEGEVGMIGKVEWDEWRGGVGGNIASGDDRKGGVEWDEWRGRVGWDGVGVMAGWDEWRGGVEWG